MALISLFGGHKENDKSIVDPSVAQRMLNKYNLGKLVSFERQDTGITGRVFSINNQYILKIQRDDMDKVRSERNALTCRILERNKIKAPRLIAVDITHSIIPEKYIIISKLEGENLRDVWQRLPEDQQKKAFFDYGKLMAEFHKIRMDKFGDPADWNHQFLGWHECITTRYKGFYDYVEQAGILDKETLKEIDNFFKENDGLLHINTKPVLIHNDFQAKNIKYLNGELNGIFDFDECLGAHNEMDFIKSCLPFKREKVWLKEIIKGYKSEGSLSNDFHERIKLYELNFCLKVLMFMHANSLMTGDLKDKFIWAIDKILTEEWDFFDSSRKWE